MVEVWLALTYVLGSVVTYFLMRKSIAYDITESIIDNLIAQGFLKSKKDKNGEVEIMKWYEENGK